MSANKVISLKTSVYELCTTYPELPEVLASIGFKDITKPGMLQTAGRIMTLEKGAALKQISIQQIVEQLNRKGYFVEED